MNNNYLRVNSEERTDGIVESKFKNINNVESYHIENEKVKSNKQLNLFTLLKDGKNNVSWRILDTNNLLSITLTIISLALLLLFLSTISKSIIFLIMSSMIISFAFPFFFMVFLFELNNMKNVSIGNICISIAIGMAYYVIVRLLCKKPIENYFSSIPTMNYFGNVILTIINDFLLFILAFITAKLFKKDCMFGTILIVVCVFAGHSIADTLNKLLSSMFINVNINTSSVSTYTSAIVNSNQFYDTTLISFLPVLFKDGIYMTILMCFWSVICGVLISSIIAPLKNESYRDLSIYLLCFSILVMHAIITIKYASLFLAFVINIIVLIITILVSIKLLNYSLERTNYGSPDIKNNKSA